MDDPHTTLGAAPESAPSATGRDLRYTGRITLRERLGAGGMGEVHLGTDAALGRAVAVKLARATGDPEAQRKFAAEARITGRLSHPGIVPVHLLAETEAGEPFFAMKRVEGEDLARRLDRIHDEDGQVDARRRLELLEVFLKICDALAYAHSRGVVHRDIKPANVMVGGFGEVLVVDWGLARVGVATPSTATQHEEALTLGDHLPRTLDGTIMGTPAYMSPEQARGDVACVDAASDQYALGAVLYQMLTLRPPFEGTIQEILDRVIAGDFLPPSSVVPWEVPWELEAVVLRAMARDAARRYPSVDELARDVRRFLEGRSVGAVRYTPRQLIAKWLERHRTLVGAIAVAGVAIVASAVTAYVRVAREAAHTQAALVRESGERARAEGALVLAAEAHEREQTQRHEVERQLATALAYKAGIAIAERRTLDGAAYLAHARALADTPIGAFLALRLSPPYALLRHRLAGCAIAPLRDGRWARLAGRSLSFDDAEWVGGPATPVDTAIGLLVVASDGSWWAEADDHHPLRVVRCDGSTRLLEGAPSRPTGLEVSRDGRWVAACDAGAQLWIWSLDVTAPPRIIGAAARGLSAMAFSADSQRLFAGWSDGVIAELELGGEEHPRLHAPESVTALSLSSDGQTLAAGLGDGSVQVWDLSNRRLKTVLHGHTSQVGVLAHDPGGRWIASADNDGRVCLWDARGELRQTLSAPRNPRTLCFAPTRNELVCGSEAETWCWELPSDPVDGPRSILATHGAGRWGYVYALALDPRGRWFATSGDYRTVKIWDLATGELRRLGWRQRHDVRALAASPNGERLLVGTADGVIAEHTLDREEPTWRHEGTAAVYDVAYSPNGQRVASITGDDVLELREADGGRLLAQIPQPAGCHGLCFSPDGRWVATPAGTWDTASFAPGLRFEPDAQPLDSVKATPVTYDAHGRWLAIGRGEAIEVFDTADGARLYRLQGHRGHVQALAVAPTLPLLVSGACDGTLRGWDLESGTPVGEALPLQRWALRLAFVGEREVLVTCGLGVTERLGIHAPATVAAAEGIAGVRRAGSSLVDGPADPRISLGPLWPRVTFPGEDPYEQAIGYSLAGHAAQALTYLDEAIARDPEAVHAFLERGTLRLLARQGAAALADLERALTLSVEQRLPRLERCALLALATACHALGHVDRAREHYRKLIERAASVPALQRRARLCLAISEPDRAKRDSEIIAVLEDEGPDTPPLFCQAVSTPVDESLGALLDSEFSGHPMAQLELYFYERGRGDEARAQAHRERALALSGQGAPHPAARERVERRLLNR